MPHGAIPFPFGDCRICNDKATGVHYGVATCEGCKGFYKRSIPKGDKYRCYFGGKCVISPENRNRCKACRFRKCLEQGMAVDAVKMGRIPKVEKERALEQAAAERHGVGEMLLHDESNAGCKPDKFTSPAPQQGDRKSCPLKRSSGSMEISGTNRPAGVVEKNKGSPGEPQAKRAAAGGSLGAGAPGFSPLHGRSEDSLQGMESVVTHGGQGHQQHMALYSSHPPRGSRIPQSYSPQDPTGFSHQVDRGNSSPVGNSHLDSGCRISNEGYLNGSAALTNGMDSDGSLSGGDCWSGANNTRTSTGLDGGVVMIKTETDTENPGQTISGDAGCQAGGAQRSAYSPGLIKMLFNQVMQSENSNQREKMMKKLARSCSQEGLSSRLELLQSVVTMGSSVLPADAALHENVCSSQGSSLRGSPPSCGYNNLSLTTHSGMSVAPELQALTTYAKPVVSLTASTASGYPVGSVGQGEVFGQQEANQGHGQEFSGALYNDGGSPGGLPQHHLQVSSEIAQLRQTGSNNLSRIPGHALPANGASHAAFGHHSFSDIPSGQQFHSPPNQMFQNGPGGATRVYAANAMHNQQEGSFREEHLYMGVQSGALKSPSDDFAHVASHFSGIGHQPEQASEVTRPSSLDSSGPPSVHEYTHFRSPDLPATQIMDQLSIPISASKEYIDLNSLCKEDQSRDKDEVLSYDGLSSVSSSDNIQMSGSLPEDLDVELDETVQTLENSIYTHFGLGLKIKQRELYYQKKRETGSPDLPCHPLDKLWGVLMESVQINNQNIIGFCKSVPGFMDLDPADQEVLLKRAYYDIWMLTASQFFLDGESYLFLHDGTFYTRCLMEQVIGKENTRTLHVFTQQFNALRLSQVEVAILCCIQLTAPGHGFAFPLHSEGLCGALDLSKKRFRLKGDAVHRISVHGRRAGEDEWSDQPNLKNPQEIQTLNSYYLDLLVAVVTHNHPVTCSRVLVDIFRLIPLLADINRLQREIIANFSISSPVFEGQVDEDLGDVKLEPSATAAVE
ncbi:hypothetical protein BaRGS_00031575 [Batillaria attramentaria]|uniref:Nuclear receptor domain-containing protein n=1 Tax=Batillaria attramentaria TaxID=370345 RepID=A0ABD0JR98_9CAEN